MSEEYQMPEEVKAITNQIIEEMASGDDKSINDATLDGIVGGSMQGTANLISLNAGRLASRFPALNAQDFTNMANDFLNAHQTRDYAGFANVSLTRTQNRGDTVPGQYKDAAVMVATIFMHYNHEVSQTDQWGYGTALLHRWS